MKKLYLIGLFIGLFILSSCSLIVDYDDVYHDYETHLAEQASLYQEQANWLNNISTSLMKGVVKVKKISTQSQFNTVGSGFIFNEDSTYYYVLTNHHITYDPNPSQANITVYDYLEQDYTATFIQGSNLYDLSVLRIRKKTQTSLYVFTFNDKDVSDNDRLVTLGYPQSQYHAIYRGVFLKYGQASIDISPLIIDVSFDVVYATMPVRSGSSGSVTLNMNNFVMGIVFAGNFEGDKTIADQALIVPISQIKTYLTSVSVAYREVTS